MSTPFDHQRGLVIVSAEIVGPSGNAVLRLALDTGATSTLINVAMLVSIGYDPALTAERVQITTGSGVEFVPRVVVSTISALGQTRNDFAVLAHTLPPSSRVDGLLGLDYLRKQLLTVDFRKGIVELT